MPGSFIHEFYYSPHSQPLPPPPPMALLITPPPSHSREKQREIVTICGLVTVIIICSIFMLWGGRRREGVAGNRDVESGRMGVAGPEQASSVSASWVLPAISVQRISEPECAVCLEAFEEGNECLVIPACSHVYHKSCIDQWLANNRQCPLCRASVNGAKQVD